MYIEQMEKEKHLFVENLFWDLTEHKFPSFSFLYSVAFVYLTS
jgi:hypothetical protein